MTLLCFFLYLQAWQIFWMTKQILWLDFKTTLTPSFYDAKDGSQTWLGRLIVTVELSGNGKTDGLLKHKETGGGSGLPKENSEKNVFHLLRTFLVGSSWSGLCKDQIFLCGRNVNSPECNRKLYKWYFLMFWMIKLIALETTHSPSARVAMDTLARRYPRLCSRMSQYFEGHFDRYW